MVFNLSLVYKKETLLKAAFFAVGLIPLSSEKIEVFLSIFFVGAITVYTLLNLKHTQTNKAYKPFLINSLLFLVLLTSFFDGIDFIMLKKLEQMVSLLIFPLALYLVSMQNKVKTNYLFEIWKKVFFISTIIFSVIAFYIISQYTNPRYPNLDSNFFQNAILDAPYFTRHPGYISIYINISIVIGISWILKSRKGIFVIGSALLVLLLLLLMLSVKIALISLLVSVTIFLFFNLSKRNVIISVLVISLSTVVFSVVVPDKYNRFSKLLDTNVLNKNIQFNSALVHKLTVICGIQVFKETPVLGVGIENAKFKVNNCVRQQYYFDPEKIYNSHNQYIAYALYSGVFGVFVLLMVLLFAMLKSFKGDRLLFVILVLYGIVFLTENVLERQSGLILFCFILNMIPALDTKRHVFLYN